MHPRDEELFQSKRRPSSGIVREVVGPAAKIVAPFHKWYKIMGTPNTEECGADEGICTLIVDYARRAMEKGGVELDDAREFEIALVHLLKRPGENCDLCSKIRGCIQFNRKTKVLRGQVVIPCKQHGCLDWTFEIGKGVSDDV